MLKGSCGGRSQGAVDPKASAGTLDAWRRQPAADSKAAEQPWKKHRCLQGGMHGTTVSDHGEKATWPGYWEERQRKLGAQEVDAGLYNSVTARLLSREGRADTAPQNASPNKVFRQCRIWFDGRVDNADGFSSFTLGKLARLHGAEVMPRLTKRGVTHVVCTQLSGSKERAALGDAASRATAPYFVRPEWITQSIAARKRQPERHFSILANVAKDAGISLIESHVTASHTKPAESVQTVQRANVVKGQCDQAATIVIDASQAQGQQRPDANVVEPSKKIQLSVIELPPEDFIEEVENDTASTELDSESSSDGEM